jgi:HEPN domain-containing protein
MLDAGDAEDAGFHLQQALEKFLKAFLGAHGQPLKRTHELPALLALAERYDPRPERFRELCERISGYYALTRLPRAGA